MGAAGVAPPAHLRLHAAEVRPPPPPNPPPLPPSDNPPPPSPYLLWGPASYKPHHHPLPDLGCWEVTPPPFLLCPPPILRAKYNLNELSHDTAMQLIQHALDNGVQVAEVRGGGLPVVGGGLVSPLPGMGEGGSWGGPIYWYGGVLGPCYVLWGKGEVGGVLSPGMGGSGVPVSWNGVRGEFGGSYLLVWGGSWGEGRDPTLFLPCLSFPNGAERGGAWG